ncbi:hypothetical protein TNCV_2697571 [Trichonephila clavipes]|nr:hypothetical protein TNCV_2697571 [Trichonephila clavipes]
MINGHTCLHVVANGTMTGQRYIDEVLLLHVRLFRGAFDLNPIENVWDALGRQVAGRNYPPTNKNTLIRALTEEWDKLPQQLLDNVVQTEIVNGVYGPDTLTVSYVQFGFRRFRSGMLVIENVDKITEMIEVDQHVSYYTITQEPEIPP